MSSIFKIEKANPSAYAQFVQCPKLFWIFNLHPNRDSFRYKNKSIGNVVEHSLHHFVRDYDPPERSLERLLAVLDTTWSRLRDMGDEWCIKSGTEETECREIAKLIIQKFFETAGPEFINSTPYYTSPTYRDLNRQFETMRHPISTNLYISGRPDRIDELERSFEIVDYKTKSKDDPVYDQKNTLQLRMYGIVVGDFLTSKGLTKPVQRLRFLYLTPEGTRSSQIFGFDQEVYNQTISEIKEVQQSIIKLWNEYGNKPWPCLCGRCAVVLSSAEKRAEEWAKYQSATAIHPAAESTDIPF